MTIDIETLRVRAGFPVDDTTHDDELNAALAQAWGLIETYCDRAFEAADEIEEFDAFDTFDRALRLRRYPVDLVTSITIFGQPVTQWRLNKKAGIVHPWPHCGFPFFDTTQPTIEIEYHGGYDPLPADLEWAVLAVFDMVWAANPAWGGGVGLVVDDVKKLSIVGVGSLDFGAASTAKGAGASVEAGEAWGPISGEVMDVLRLYRSNVPVGGV
jgi:hypothetical protein